MQTTVAACVTSIAPRHEMRRRAIASVMAQTRPVDELHLVVDHYGVGAAATRNHAWRAVSTDWIAFLDDDDEWFPDHIAKLVELATSTDVDLIYPWFELPVGTDPLAVRVDGQLRTPLGVEFSAEQATYILTEGNFIPVTVLVRRTALINIGGFPEPRTPEWPHTECEDWGCWQRLLRAGYVFKHLPERTWRWNWHGMNTSGRGDRWKRTA